MQRNLIRALVMGMVALLAAACAKSRSSHPAGTPAAPAPQGYDANGGGPRGYAGAQLDPRTALDGMGHWVQIEDESYFVPDARQLEDDDGDEWAPYQRGYWNYDEEKSWTWVSYEPFGWLTDHYGVWRHHSRHGWIWLPFRDRHYEPHTVTWFDEGDYVGWYPYFADYSHAYRHGFEHGFDDGYWDSYNVVLRLGQPGFNFRMGFTLVNRSSFAHENIRLVIARDQALIYRLAATAHAPDRIRLGRIGRYPGGHRERAYDFLQRYSSRRAPMGRTELIRSRGGAEIRQPKRTYQMPEQYRRRFERPVAPGRPGGPDRRDERRDDRRGEFARPEPRRQEPRVPEAQRTPESPRVPQVQPVENRPAEARPMRPQVVPPGTPATRVESPGAPRREVGARERVATNPSPGATAPGARPGNEEDQRRGRDRRH